MSDYIPLDAQEIELIFNASELEEIYRIDGAGKTYVGRCNLIRSDGIPRGRAIRFREHISAAKSGKLYRCCRVLGEAINLYGEESFHITQIEVVHTSQASEREKFWMKELGTIHPKGYNLVCDTLHPETIDKMSAALRSYGVDSTPYFKGTVHRVTAPNCIGYRGFHNGMPKGFFGTQFSINDRFAMAVQWHLFGEYDYEQRLPRARANLDPNGMELPTGVKFDPYRNTKKPYRAYHSQLQNELKSPYFATLTEAADYAKMLRSFDGQSIPIELFADKRNPDDAKDPFLVYIKPRQSSGSIKTEQGTLVGYEIVLPHHVTVSGNLERNTFSKEIFSIEQNLSNAIEFRKQHMKFDLLPSEPSWVDDLPLPHTGPDKSYISEKKRKGSLIGYELNIPAAYTKSGSEFYFACTKTSVSVDENLMTVLAFRYNNIKAGVISGLVLQGAIHPCYLEEKHQYMWARKSPGSSKIAKGAIVGWVVEVPKERSIDGLRHKVSRKTLDEARVVRKQLVNSKYLKED